MLPAGATASDAVCQFVFWGFKCEEMSRDCCSRRICVQRDGDMDLAAALGIAVATIMQECLFEYPGLLLQAFSSTAVRELLQAILLMQEGMLLPIWALLVMRWAGRV